MSFLEMYLLALGGFGVHFFKMWLTALKRKEKFITGVTLVWLAFNLLCSALLIYVGPTLPPDVLVMSPITCILIGLSGSSLLAGIINVKKPRYLETTEYETEGPEGRTKIRKDKLPEVHTMDDEGPDSGGSQPPPDKPKPPTPPGG